MERGQIAESDSHDALLRNPQGIYAHLHALQQGHASAAA
jgi:subfamily B ATP-binding cassette protein HlyB/CyaB